MKHLGPEANKAVIRELDECPAIVRWLVGSRDENRVLLEETKSEALAGIQGENKSINQMLDKRTDT